jgi:hypothetical protein
MEVNPLVEHCRHTGALSPPPYTRGARDCSWRAANVDAEQRTIGIAVAVTRRVEKARGKRTTPRLFSRTVLNWLTIVALQGDYCPQPT